MRTTAIHITPEEALRLAVKLTELVAPLDFND